jgi:oligosaccharide reducing-end xylanase
MLGPIHGPALYPNPFRDLLGKSDSDIRAKVSAAFEQLFHGDSSTEAIFVETGTDQAYILDVLHNQVRSEGLGLGMMISVSLDKRTEFDRLWRYAKSAQVASGGAQGYLSSFCGAAGSGVSCYDPFGLEQIATALLLARGRWQASPGDIDYGLEAATLLDTIRNKEIYNCGIEDNVTALFDSNSKLPYDTPTTSSAGVSRPSVVMPAYYELWSQATGDPFWAQAAAAGRAYWKASADRSTGLVPNKATFDGKPVSGADNFDAESGRTLFNMAIDGIWFGGQPWLSDESDRLLQFFDGRGISSYGHLFTLAGESLDTVHDRALVSANGTLAMIASTDLRRDFVSEAWSLGSPLTGSVRYYPGILQLFGLVMLSGQLRVY